MFVGSRVPQAAKVTQMRVFLKGSQRLQELEISSPGDSSPSPPCTEVATAGPVMLGVFKGNALAGVLPTTLLFYFLCPPAIPPRKHS